MKNVPVKFRNRALVIFSLCVLNSMLPIHAAQADDFILENDYVRFEFEEKHMGLKAMIDKATGTNHFRVIDDEHFLWEIVLRHGTHEATIANNSQSARYDPPPECTSARIEVLSDGTQRAIMDWIGIDWWREEKALNITVTVDLPGHKGIAEWRINVDNNSDIWGLWEVRFPYFCQKL